MSWSMCDVRCCSMVRSPDDLASFPPSDKPHVRAMWWEALYGRVNFDLTASSVLRVHVCDRHFTGLSFVPCSFLGKRSCFSVPPIPTELVRQNSTEQGSVRTYSRKAPVPKFRTIAPAALVPQQLQQLHPRPTQQLVLTAPTISQQRPILIRAVHQPALHIQPTCYPISRPAVALSRMSSAPSTAASMVLLTSQSGVMRAPAAAIAVRAAAHIATMHTQTLRPVRASAQTPLHALRPAFNRTITVGRARPSFVYMNGPPAATSVRVPISRVVTHATDVAVPSNRRLAPKTTSQPPEPSARCTSKRLRTAQPPVYVELVSDDDGTTVDAEELQTEGGASASVEDMELSDGSGEGCVPAADAEEAMDDAVVHVIAVTADSEDRTKIELAAPDMEPETVDITLETDNKGDDVSEMAAEDTKSDAAVEYQTLDDNMIVVDAEDTGAGDQPRLIRLKPISELMMYTGGEQPPRVPTPPQISLGGAEPRGEVDLLLASMQARDRAEALQTAAAPPVSSPPPAAGPQRRAPRRQGADTSQPSSPPQQLQEPAVDATSCNQLPSDHAGSNTELLARVRSELAACRTDCHREREHHGQQLRLSTLLDQMFTSSLRTQWEHCKRLVDAVSDRETLLALLNYFSLANVTAGVGVDGGCVTEDVQDVHDCINVDDTHTDSGRSLPSGLTILPVPTTEQQPQQTGCGGSSSPVGSDVDDTPSAVSVDPPSDAPPSQRSPLSQDDRRRLVRFVSCQLCGAAGFDSWLQLSRHMACAHEHHGVLASDSRCEPERLVLCPFCRHPASLTTGVRIEEHLVGVHAAAVLREYADPATQLVCACCQQEPAFRTAVPAELERHAASCHARFSGSLELPNWRCTGCGVLQPLAHQMAVMHLVRHAAKRAVQQCRCHFCAFCASPRLCEHHVRSAHHGRCRLLGCLLCSGFMADTWSAMEQHVLELHRDADTPPLCRCSVCAVQLSAADGAVLQMHARMHTSNKLSEEASPVTSQDPQTAEETATAGVVGATDIKSEFPASRRLHTAVLVKTECAERTDTECEQAATPVDDKSTVLSQRHLSPAFQPQLRLKRVKVSPVPS